MLIPLTLVVGTIGSLDGIGLDLTGPAFAQSQQPRANFTSAEQQLPTKGNSFKIDNGKDNITHCISSTGIVCIRSS
jgi:hypothetical protein